MPGDWTHEDLCARACRWLSGTRQCRPVFSNIASCSEIPDAIGWSSRYGWEGSTVVECKTSVSDFYADKKKYQYFLHPGDPERIGGGIRYSLDRMSAKFAAEHGYVVRDDSRMGDYRFFMCGAGVLPVELVTRHAPDHGLLYADGRRIRVVYPAPKRESLVDRDAEIRYLRFAIINRKPDMTVSESFLDAGALLAPGVEV